MESVRKVYLHPGELLFTQVPCEVVTVLGSCVAVTMFCPRYQAASICHVMLPKPTSNTSLDEQDAHLYRYAIHAIPAMVDRFRAIGAKAGDIESRVFGGSRLAGLDSAPAGVYRVGDSNVKSVKALLEGARLLVTEMNVGDAGCRRLVFDTASGYVKCLRVSCDILKKAAPKRGSEVTR